MKIVNVHHAKTHLSQLLADAERGEDIVIARQGVPVARLVAVASSTSPEPGAWRSKPGWANYTFDAAALAPLRTDEEVAAEGWPV